VTRRLLKTIRLDGTDARVFECAAEPGEWAIPGGFAFADDSPDGLTGKRLQAFRCGFLGLGSFGWSTLVTVAEASDAAFDLAEAALARHFVETYGAPTLEEATAAARAELEFGAGLCEGPINTLLRLERKLEEDGVIERFRVVKPAAAQNHARIWDLTEDDG
jgi:hypothetical protein